MPKIELLEVRPKRKYVRKAKKEEELENIVEKLDNLILKPKEEEEKELCNDFKKIKISKKIVFSNNDFPNQNDIKKEEEIKIPILRVSPKIVPEVPKNQIEFIPIEEYTFDKEINIYISYVYEEDMSKTFNKYIFYTRVLKNGSGHIECVLEKPPNYMKYKGSEEIITLKENVKLHIIKYKVEKMKYGKECIENLENNFKRKYDMSTFEYDFCQLKMKNMNIQENKYYIKYDGKNISFKI